MSKFVELSSLGVSKDSQQRAAKIMGVICDGYQNCKAKNSELFFEHCQNLMAQRWERLREVVERNEFFSLPKYPKEYCHFSGELNEPHPGNDRWYICDIVRNHKMMFKILMHCLILFNLYMQHLRG